MSPAMTSSMAAARSGGRLARLLATARCDVQLQLRNGFYWAVGVLLVACAVLISQLRHLDWAAWIPPLILGNLILATFVFMAGLVLLEKGEGTLEAQVVTPLSSGEYLASKVATLTALSLVENVIVALLACGWELRLAPLVLGIALASAIYCLAGFVTVARYDSINEYLLPAILYTSALELPILHYTGLWRSPLMYLHPMQAPLVVLRGATGALEPWEWLYGLGYSALWIALTLAWARRRYDRFVTAAVGGR